MKKINEVKRIVLLFLLLSVVFISCQQKKAEAPNPPESIAPYEVSQNGDANLKLVKDYIDALVKGDPNTAKNFVADKFMDYGPSAKDSANIDQVIKGWIETSKVRSNQEAGIFVNTTLKVNEGNFAGEWVQVWGNYTAKMNESGYEFDVPWHRVFLIKDNKIVLTRVWYDSLKISLEMGTVVPSE